MARDPLIWFAYILGTFAPLPKRTRNHLADCVSYPTVFRVFAPDLPPLRAKHVLGIVALPRRTTADILVHPVVEGVEQSVSAGGDPPELEHGDNVVVIKRRLASL